MNEILVDRPGQLGNRLQMALVREAAHIVAEGIADALSGLDDPVLVGIEQQLRLRFSQLDTNKDGQLNLQARSVPQGSRRVAFAIEVMRPAPGIRCAK